MVIGLSEAAEAPLRLGTEAVLLTDLLTGLLTKAALPGLERLEIPDRKARSV
jgi:hypothetical protein